VSALALLSRGLTLTIPSHRLFSPSSFAIEGQLVNVPDLAPHWIYLYVSSNMHKPHLILLITASPPFRAFLLCCSCPAPAMTTSSSLNLTPSLIGFLLSSVLCYGCQILTGSSSLITYALTPRPASPPRLQLIGFLLIL
jgi:hypothetical protein